MNPTRHCYKIWNESGYKLRSDPKQASGAGFTVTTPAKGYYHDNNIWLLLLPGTQLNTASIISRHTSPKLRWPKKAKVILEWIAQIRNFLKPSSWYHVNTDGSYEKSSPAYDDIFLADNGPDQPDRISSGASLIIAPLSEDWRDKQHSLLLCIHIKDGSTIGAQSVYPMELMAIVADNQIADQKQI